jgi:hypothetical protein
MQLRAPPRCAIALGCVVFASACYHRNATIRPALTIRVIDPAGAPVANTQVMIMHEVSPGSEACDWWPMVTGADGTVSTTRLTRGEMVAPFVMHGVPHHAFFVCAGKQGSGVEIARVDGDKVELHLHDDYRDDCWNRNVYLGGGQLGWKLTKGELDHGRSQVDRLPPEGHYPGSDQP